MESVLWNNILDFNVDDPISEYDFSTKLENENFWTVNFAREAILEYKKFMYLATISDEMVSPSDIVDIVWHQHLIFTQSYDRFCILLGKRIAHIPSTHHKSDFDKFKVAKQLTKKLYNENFGEQPSQIWDYPDIYGPLRLNISALSATRIFCIGALLLVPTLIVGYQGLYHLYITINNPYFIYGYIASIITCLTILEFYNKLNLNKMLSRWNANAFIFNLTAMELIYLQKNRIENVIDGIVNHLILKGNILVEGNGILKVNIFSGISDKAELGVLQTINENPKVSYEVLVGLLKKRPAFYKIERTIDAFKKRVSHSKPFIQLFLVNFMVFSVLFVLGAVRLATGVNRNKPVTIIAFTLITYLAVIIWSLYRVKMAISAKTIPEFYYHYVISESPVYTNWDWKYFLLGSTVFAPSFLPLTEYGNNYGDTGGSDAGSTGDGGASGGGCGGCGSD